MIVSGGGGGEGFTPFKSCPGEMVMDEIDTCIKRGNVSRWKIAGFHFGDSFVLLHIDCV